MATATAKFDIKAHDKTKAAFNSVQSRLKGISKSLTSFKGLAGAAIAALGVKQIYQTTASYEKLEASLRTVTGSMANASSAMRTIREFTATTPFQVTEVADAFIKLKALGLEPSEKALESYGNTSSAMGKSLNQMIEAVADASTNEFERLKEFGIKSRSEGDRVKFTFQGITTEVGKNSQEIQNYLLDIGQTKFAGAMAQQMETLGGKSSNLSDAFDNLMVALGDAGLTAAFKGALTWATNIVNFISTQAIPAFSFFAEKIGLLKKEVNKLTDDEIHARMSSLSDKIKETGERLANLQKVGDVSNAAVARERLMQQAAEYTKLNEQLSINTQKIIENKAAAGTGANGEGGSKQYEVELKRQEELNKSMLDLSRGFYSEKEKVDVLYWERKTELENLYLEGKISSEEERRDLELQITEDHEKSLTAITKKETVQRAAAEQRVSAQIIAMKYQVAQQSINLLSLVVGESKAGQIVVLALQKGLALAQLSVSTQVAMMQAMAQLGPIAGPPAAAGIATMGSISAGFIVATGIAQAASIASGGSAPSLGSPTNPVNTQPAVDNSFPGTSDSSAQSLERTETLIIKGVDPDKIFTGQQMRDFAERLTESNTRGVSFV